jgi:hypothetical protein
VTATALTLEEYGRCIGELVWLERRCFEVLGAHARAESDAGAKLALATASAHHGFHAVLLEPLLPDTRDHRPDELIAPPRSGIDLTDPASATAEALLRALAEAHARAAEAVTPVAESAARRVLAMVAVDHKGAGSGMGA